MTTRRVGDTKYAPLLRYLAAQPPDVAAVTLGFDELERLIGAPLAVSARVASGYWSTGTMAIHTWRAYGWTGYVLGKRQAVQFSRIPPRPADTPAPDRRRRADSAAIIAAYQAGTPGTELAEQHGITRQGVYDVLRRAGIPRRRRR